MTFAPIVISSELRIVPRVPATRELAPVMLLPQLRTEARLAQVLPLLFRCMSSTVNGLPVTLADADGWAARPSVAGELLGRLQALLESLAEAGMVYALCPHCRQWEADLTMAALLTLLAAEMPPIFTGPFLELPMLSRSLRRGWRPPAIRSAARLRVRLPSARGSGAAAPPELTLGPVEEQVASPATPLPGPRERLAWERWAPDGSSTARPRHWHRSNALFHAEVRLAIATANDPAAIDEMPAGDFYCLDALYALLFETDVRDIRRATIHCLGCAEPFLPLG